MKLSCRQRRVLFPVLGGLAGYIIGMTVNVFGLVILGLVATFHLGYMLSDWMYLKRATLWLHHIAVSIQAMARLDPDELAQVPGLSHPVTFLLDSHEYFFRMPLRVLVKCKWPESIGEAPPGS